MLMLLEFPFNEFSPSIGSQGIRPFNARAFTFLEPGVAKIHRFGLNDRLSA